jgi:hypothetical protein
MISYMLSLVLAIVCSLTSPLFPSTKRGDRLITEAGGAQGIAGVAGPAGAPGLAGAAGAAGIQGISGIPGAPGVLGFADFYALQGGAFNDNPAPVAAGAAVNFPRDGSISGAITRTGPSSFNLTTIGTYLVLFQVDVTAAAQLMLELNSGLIADSVVGRATGSSQITGLSLVTTTTSNSVLEVVNPPGNSTTIVVPNDDGGTQPISAHLVIIRVQ